MDNNMNANVKSRYNLLDMIVDMLREKEGTMRQLDWDEKVPQFVQINRVHKRLGQVHVEYTSPDGESMVLVLDAHNVRR
jgi:hypothetical protein